MYKNEINILMVFIYMYMNLIFCKMVVVFLCNFMLFRRDKVINNIQIYVMIESLKMGYFLNMFLLSCYYGVMISLKGLNEWFIIYINSKVII